MKDHRIGRHAGLLLIILLATAGNATAGNPDPAPTWTAGGGAGNTSFGNGVSTAGDVNGDGFSDIVVGAPLHHNLITTPGRAVIFLGSMNGLGNTPAWIKVGSSDLESFGEVVSTAGDVNGDGFDDVIVAAPGFSNGQASEGKVQLFLGSAGGLSTTAAWAIESNQANSGFGHAIAGGGDLNADGFDDVLVGAYEASNGQATEGILYIYHGSPAGLPAQPTAVREMNQANARFATSVAIAGDVNADGFDDAIVGAWTWSNGQTNEGAAFVYLGSPSGLGTTPAWSAESDQQFAYLGGAVSMAGDMNGDGYTDVAVGAHWFDSPQGGNVGQARVYRGSATGVESAPILTINGIQAGSEFGCSVSPAGDVDGDGYADLAVGAGMYDDDETDEGMVRVLHGGPLGLAAGSDYYQSGQVGAHFGSRVATAGDVDGDGRSDLLVGSWSYDSPGFSNDGRAFVYHGRSRDLASLPSWIWYGPDEPSFFSVETQVAAGDFNGDGYSDMAIGSPLYRAADIYGAGRVSVFEGRSGGLAPSPDWTVEGAWANARMGRGLAAGDFNADGYEDLAVGAPGDEFDDPDPTKLHVFFGSPDGLASQANITIAGEQDGSAFSGVLANAGDVNGDGYVDLLVGAWSFVAPGKGMCGKAYLFFGGPQGIAEESKLTITGPLGDDGRFASEVAGGVDVNEDGYSDWFVAMPMNGDYGTGPGVVYVYLGGTDPDSVQDTEIIGGQEYERFGAAMSAGDANGDGIGDLVVGAPSHGVSGLWQAGKIYLYHGPITGPLSPAPDWTVTGVEEDGRLGTVVSMTGDANGDGMNDIVAGAPIHSLSSWDIYVGKAYLFEAPFHPVYGDDPVWVLEGVERGDYVGYVGGFAGDLNGDGFSDVVVASRHDPNPSASGDGIKLRLFPGNAATGLPRIPRQNRSDLATPVAPLSGSNGNVFAIAGLARTAIGRDKVRLEWEVSHHGFPLSGFSVATGPEFDTGTPVPGEGSRIPVIQPITGAVEGHLLHWRMRVAGDSPFFPTTRWVSLPGNGPNETDIRITPAGTSGVEETQGGTAGPGLSLQGPNPFRNATAVRFTLKSSGPARLDVFDVSGRLVRRLADDWLAAGSHEVPWNGLDEAGQAAPGGVYFVRLEAGGMETAIRVIRAK